VATVTCALASVEPGTVLDIVLRFPMFGFKNKEERRIGYFPGIEDGIVQDYGIEESDGKIIGQPYVSSTEGILLESMYESSTTYWGLSDGRYVYKVYFMSLEKTESHGNKTIYDVEFGIKERWDGS